MKLRNIIHMNLETGTQKKYSSIRHIMDVAWITKYFICHSLKTGKPDKDGNLFISEDIQMTPDESVLKKKEYQKKYKDELKEAKANGTYKPKENNKTPPCAYDIEMKQIEKQVLKYKKEMAIIDEEARKAQIKNKVKDDLDDYYRK